MDLIGKWVIVFETYLLNIFTVPDDDCYNYYCVEYAVKNLIWIWNNIYMYASYQSYLNLNEFIYYVAIVGKFGIVQI